jgi:hypothetical protein
MSTQTLRAICKQRVDLPFQESYFTDSAMQHTQVCRTSLDGQMLDAVVFQSIQDKLELLDLYEKVVFGKQSNDDKVEMTFEIMRRSGMITPANRNESPINPEEGD